MIVERITVRLDVHNCITPQVVQTLMLLKNKSLYSLCFLFCSFINPHIRKLDSRLVLHVPRYVAAYQALLQLLQNYAERYTEIHEKKAKKGVCVLFLVLKVSRAFFIFVLPGYRQVAKLFSSTSHDVTNHLLSLAPFSILFTIVCS